MADQQHLLFELGTEELPPKSLHKLSQALLTNITKGLKDAGLNFTKNSAYATPRRLAVIIENLDTGQPDKQVEKRGPAVQAAFAEDGTPSKAAEGFAKGCGVSVDQLERLKTDKGEWLSYTQDIVGQSTQKLIPDIINHSLSLLPIAKKMRWGASSTEFVRPVHWAVLLFGQEVIAAEILGVTSGAETRGHRFHAPEQITLTHPEEYLETLLQQGKVIADFEQRKNIIRNTAQKAAQAVNSVVHIEEDLLEEITALNEWPVPVTGNFDEKYLALPDECLITTMQTNQKYFPVIGENGKLLPHFITFSNIESTRPESIQQGNERVITPRLADAEFFWNQDRKQSLSARIESLSTIIFQKKLGTLADKSTRVSLLAEYIAQQLGADVDLAKRAAQLAKTDLMTEMVGEFPSLQGIMGRYYAVADQESEEVAQALEEQYFPKQSGSPIPESRTGQILAIAEKMDTLTGIFSAGLIPTGDKDPYALRRATLGILRIIIEGELPLNILDLLDFSLTQFNHEFDLNATHTLLKNFIFERLKHYNLEGGYTANEFEAVFAVLPEQPLDFQQRLQAVKAFRELPEAESLASANKRIRNILKKSGTAQSSKIGVLVEKEEIKLLESAQVTASEVKPLLEQHDYQAALTCLAQLRDDVDAFFDHVMVMCDDPELRTSRLGLLAMLSDQFLQIADISKLQS